jgi:hypothetical protein
MTFECYCSDNSLSPQKRSANSNDGLSEAIHKDLENDYFAPFCTRDEGADFTNRRATALINDIEKLPADGDIKSKAAFIKMMFTTEKMENGACPEDEEKGIYALASKLEDGIHARTFITPNFGNDNFPYSVHITWHGNNEVFPFG